VASCKWYLAPLKGRKLGWVAGLALLPLVLGVASAGGRAFAVSPVTVQVLGKGTVTSDPAGINCGNGQTTCYMAFSGSGTITLTATPAADWTFDHWDCPIPTLPGDDTCEVPVDGNSYEATAHFNGPPTSTSTLSVTHSGSGNVHDEGGEEIDCGSAPPGADCTWTELTGSTLTVHQTPADGNVFTGWGGACSGQDVTCTVHLTDDRNVSATWASTSAVLLTVSVSGGGTVTGGGIHCPTECAASQAVNSTVVLTASPADGYVFTSWDGACTGTARTCSVLMDTAKSVTATFTPVVQLSVGVNGNGNVSGESGAINCGANGNVCSANFPIDSTVTLTATPAVGETFAGWSGACGGTTTTCTVLMSSAKSVTATFTPEVQLGVTVAGNGNVSGEAGAINCGNNGNVCTAHFVTNKTVTLNATPAAGATFLGWSGACGGTASTCTVLMSSSKNVTATFSGGTGTTVPLSVSVGGPGSVTGSGINCGNGATACSANAAVNSTVTLVATPASGATFAGWGGACGGASSTCTLSMSVARSVSATFTGGSSATFPLLVTVSGRGTVSGPGIACGNGGTACSANATAGSVVTLLATPASGARFVRWSGACNGTARTCSLTMSAAQNVSATFGAAQRRALTIRVTGRGRVSSPAGRCTGAGRAKKCIQQFASGRRIVLTATPSANARFVRWGGACRGTKRTCPVTMNAAKNVTATFAQRRSRRR
jgi:uncharacterized repeat protein (TIGR02543 family)